MTDQSLGRKKRKITYAASPRGVEKAEKALKRLGFESKSDFANSKFLSRSTVTKFFQCQSIQFDSLKRICEALRLEWKEIVQICEEEQSKRLEINEPSHSDTNERVEQVQTLYRKVTVLDKQSQVIKAVIVLEGDFNSINNNLSVLLQAILRENSGDTIKITDIKKGSIRLIIEGSPEDIERLISRFNSGELTEVSGFPVENVQILNESSDDDESNELDDKWRLVQEIVSQVVDTRNLSDADLSDADLSGANLSGANLSDADLSDADLSDADLSDANLSGANLSGANLSRVNLMDANLSDADLSGANLSKAYLIRTYLVGANLSNVNIDGVNVNSINLSGSFLIRAILTGLRLNYTNLSGVNLSDADLSNADLSNADLSSADLSGANLRRTNLSRANLHIVNLRHANLTYARLLNASLIGSDLTLANLSGANLSGANLSGAVMSHIKLHLVNLSDANLSGANLSGANLSGANLSGANLSGAVVEEAQFGANLGLTEEMKLDLKRRRAIFKESEGERSGVLNRLMSERKIYFNLSNASIIGGYSETVRAEQLDGTINNYPPEKRQTLVEAAAEIQQLLQQLEQTYPTNTALEKQVVVTEAIRQIENNPTLKARVMAALKAGGVEALKQLADNPLIYILLAALERWQEGE